MSERILLVQLADIGNLILTTPAIAALREERPDAHLSLLVAQHSAAVIEEGLVDAVITLDRRIFNSSYALLFPSNFAQIWKLGQYDTIVFFHHFTLKLGTLKFWLLARITRAKRVIGLDNGNGWFLTHSVPDAGFGAKHEAEYALELVALLGAPKLPRRAQVAFDDGVLPLPLKRGVRVIIHAGSGGYNLARRWLPQHFAAVADALHDEFGAELVLVGTREDGAEAVERAMQHSPINLTGKTSLTQLADVIRSADLYIGADSGVMHLAAAVRIPVIAIFGPSNHKAWGPWSPGGKTVILRSAPECSPCAYIQHGLGAQGGCAARTCMRMVTPQMVLEQARAILNDAALPPVKDADTQARDWTDRVLILGFPVDRISYSQWLDLIRLWVRRGDRCYHVLTANPEFLMIAQKDPIFATILRRADLCVPDGSGLLWASRLLQNPLQERVTGSDGIFHIARAAAQEGWKLFLLGAAPGVAATTAQILCEEYPGLQIAGTFSGSPAPVEEDAIVQIVNESGADILLVAYGAPEQDKWIARNLPRLRTAMAVGVGGTFDYVSGKVPRAPQWMRDMHLEWLYRLYQNPKRIGRMMRLPRFVIHVLIRGAN